jgi:hypothetical protein
LDGPLPKLCPAVMLSHQDGRHSAVALLLKAAFDLGERLQAPGSLWFHLCFCIVKQTFTRGGRDHMVVEFRTTCAIDGKV